MSKNKEILDGAPRALVPRGDGSTRSALEPLPTLTKERELVRRDS